MQSTVKQNLKILVINCGSSSIKYQLFDMRQRRVEAAGLLEQIGEAQSRLTHHTRSRQDAMQKKVKTQTVADHRQGFALIDQMMTATGALGSFTELFGIGHRVVHGGEAFRAPTLIDRTVIDTIRRMVPLAPLHNPANLVGIEVALEHAPQVPQVAVFDTAFHHTLPPQAFHYALPQDLYQHHHVRRYGFHGTSHAYVSRQAADHLQRPLDSLTLISLHLGNGASAAAVKNGCSVDTSMGMTPLEGLIMGTRSGDLDPAIVFYLIRETGKTGQEIEALLNRHSGLKGICGANDMRDILQLAEEGNAAAQLAISMYTYRIKKYIGAYTAVLGRVDALVFTAGIGENAADIRQRCCQGLAHIGIVLDEHKNARRSADTREIQAAGSAVKILVIPTDEELEIAEQTLGEIHNAAQTAS